MPCVRSIYRYGSDAASLELEALSDAPDLEDSLLDLLMWDIRPPPLKGGESTSPDLKL